MSLSVYLEGPNGEELYWRNITHNLTPMADAAGLYRAVWRPDENGIEKAEQLIAPLIGGLKRLRAIPETFEQFNPENGWGSYTGLVNFVSEYLTACQVNPDATVRVCR